MSGPGSLEISKTLKGECGKFEPAYPGDTIEWELVMTNSTSEDVSFLINDPLPTCVESAAAVVKEATNGAEGPAGPLPIVEGPVFLPAYSSICITITGVIAADAPCPSTTSNCVEMISQVTDEDGNFKVFRSFESSEPAQIGDWDQGRHPKFCDRTTVDQTEILFHLLGGNDVDRMQCCLDLLERCVDLCDVVNSLNTLLEAAGEPTLGGAVSPLPTGSGKKAEFLAAATAQAAATIVRGEVLAQVKPATAIKIKTLTAFGSGKVKEVSPVKEVTPVKETK